MFTCSALMVPEPTAEPSATVIETWPAWFSIEPAWSVGTPLTSWAVQNTGSDPFELQKQQQAQQQQAASATQGSAVRGAARGAAGGALIGGIAGDAGKGAAIGAATGAVVNRSRARRAQDQAESSAAATGAQIDNFKKAFSVCLEGKKYLVKY